MPQATPIDYDPFTEALAAQQAREAAAQRVKGRVETKDFTPTLEDFVKSIPGGALQSLLNQGSADARAAQIEMGQPQDVPSSEDVSQLLSGFHQPSTGAGEIGRFLGEAAGAPTSYVTGPAMKAVATLPMAKRIPAAAGVQAAGYAPFMAPDSAKSEEGQENVPVGERPQTGEWWRTKRAPAPQMPPIPAEVLLTPEEEKSFTLPQPPDPKELAKLSGGQQRLARVQGYENEKARLTTARIAALEKKKADLNVERFKEHDRLQREYDKEQERLDKLDLEYKEANENFRRKHPALATALPMVGAAVGGALPYAARSKAQSINNKLVRDFEDAIERAEAAAAKAAGATSEKAGMRTELTKKLDPKAPIGLARSKNVNPSLGAEVGSVATGALGGIEGSILPYELDLALPLDSPDRREAAEPSKWVERALQQALPGGLAGHVGAAAPLLRKGLVPDIERAQGLIKRLPAGRSTSKKSSVQALTPEQEQLQRLEAALALQEGNKQALRAAK